MQNSTPIFRARRRLIVCACSAAVVPVHFAYAESWPARSLEWVVPYPAGGGSDVVARVLAEPMAKTLGQPIIISNRPGAATNIGAEYVVRAKADGYTLLTADTATLAANPSLYSRLGYSAEKDLQSVGLICRFNLVLAVHPSVPVKNLSEFLAWAKAQPDTINYASPGAGSPHHLATELFRQRTGLRLTHVPYRGLAPALQDVAGGQVPFMFVDSAGGYGFINSGKLRPLGVANLKRLATFANVATLDEQGLKGFEAFAWQGITVPTGTPVYAINKMSEALNAALSSTSVKARFQVLGVEPIASTPASMGSYVKQERDKWRRVIQDSGIKLE